MLALLCRWAFVTTANKPRTRVKANALILHSGLRVLPVPLALPSILVTTTLLLCAGMAEPAGSETLGFRSGIVTLTNTAERLRFLQPAVDAQMATSPVASAGQKYNGLKESREQAPTDCNAEEWCTTNETCEELINSL